VQPRRLHIDHVVLAKSHPGNQRVQADVRLLTTAQRVEHPAIHQQEIGPVGGHVAQPDHSPHHPVIEAGEQDRASGVFLPLGANRPDHLGAGAPFLEERNHRFRRVLQIGRKNHGALPPGRFQSASHGQMGARVSGQPYAAHTAVGGGDSPYDVERPVARMIVHHGPFPGLSRAGEHFDQPLVQDRQVDCLIVSRGNDREDRNGWGHSRHRLAPGRAAPRGKSVSSLESLLRISHKVTKKVAESRTGGTNLSCPRYVRPDKRERPPLERV